MVCFHCGAEHHTPLLFDRLLEDGLVLAQSCPSCGHIVGIRRRVTGDPWSSPAALSSIEQARLRFTRWRLAGECRAQVAPVLLLPPPALRPAA